MQAARRELLQNLAERIRAIEVERKPRRTGIDLGIPGFETILPEGCLAAGTLIELVSAADGAGAGSLGLILARQACGERKAFVVVDMQRSFYPPAAARLGIDLQRAIVVRPKTQRDLTAAVTQALRCEAVGAVLGWCERLSALEARQFQLAAETGGGLGLLLRPAAILATPSFATVRLVVTPAASVNFFRRLHVEVVRHHGGATGQSLLLELDDETGHVRVPAEVAVAKTVSRAARASG